MKRNRGRANLICWCIAVPVIVAVAFCMVALTMILVGMVRGDMEGGMFVVLTISFVLAAFFGLVTFRARECHDAIADHYTVVYSPEFDVYEAVRVRALYDDFCKLDCVRIVGYMIPKVKVIANPVLEKIVEIFMPGLPR